MSARPSPSPSVLPTASFRRQHEELVGMAAEIERRLVAERVREEAAELRGLLGALGEEISVHSILEEHGLYEPLYQSGDPRIVATAKRLHAEFGVIYGVVSAFVLTWTDEGALERDADAFILEAGKIFDALRKRIAKEHTELYPLFDAAR